MQISRFMPSMLVILGDIFMFDWLKSSVRKWTRSSLLLQPKLMHTWDIVHFSGVTSRNITCNVEYGWFSFKAKSFWITFLKRVCTHMHPFALTPSIKPANQCCALALQLFTNAIRIKRSHISLLAPLAPSELLICLGVRVTFGREKHRRPAGRHHRPDSLRNRCWITEKELETKQN